MFEPAASISAFRLFITIVTCCSNVRSGNGGAGVPLAHAFRYCALNSASNAGKPETNIRFPCLMHKLYGAPVSSDGSEMFLFFIDEPLAQSEFEAVD